MPNSDETKVTQDGCLISCQCILCKEWRERRTKTPDYAAQAVLQLPNQLEKLLTRCETLLNNAEVVPRIVHDKSGVSINYGSDMYQISIDDISALAEYVQFLRG